MSIKAILFDLDGTLILSEKFYFKVFSTILKPYGIKLTKKEHEQFIMGHTLDITFPTLMKMHGIKTYDTAQLIEAFRVEKKRVVLNDPKKHMSVAKGAISFLAYAKKHFKVGLVTSNIADSTSLLLDKFDMLEYFHLIITADDVLRGKPAPDPFILAAKKLKVKPSECLVFEDSLAGVQSAKAAKMKCICLVNKHQEADFWIEDFTQILINKNN